MSAIEVVRLGLIKFPVPGTVFPGRLCGTDKTYVIDARGAGSYPVLRRIIVAELLKEASLLPDFDVFAGISKSGTVWAAWSAWATDTPFANVLLDGPRASGLQREVEGEVSGQRVVLVDNWIRSGTSISKAIDVIQRAGGIAVGALTIVRNHDVNLTIPLRSPWTIGDLLEAAQEEGLWVPVPIPPASPTNNDNIIHIQGELI